MDHIYIHVFYTPRDLAVLILTFFLGATMSALAIVTITILLQTYLRKACYGPHPLFIEMLDLCIDIHDRFHPPTISQAMSALHNLQLLSSFHFPSTIVTGAVPPSTSLP